MNSEAVSPDELQNRAVEDHHAGPGFFVGVDELLVSLGDLISIVRGTIGKDHVQCDVKILVDRSVEFLVANAHREVNDSIVTGKVLVDFGDQVIDGCLRAIVERKKNVVGEFGHDRQRGLKWGWRQERGYGTGDSLHQNAD
jgi:hypothetical protein